MDARGLYALALVFLMAIAPAGHAGPYEWLKDSPAGHFTDEDWRLMKQALQTALDSGRSGDRLAWKNESTGHSGWIQAANSVEREGMRCRKARIFNSAGGLTSQQVHLFCKQPSESEWKVAPSSP